MHPRKTHLATMCAFLALAAAIAGAQAQPGARASLDRDLSALRDAVYDTTHPPAEVSASADALLPRTRALGLPGKEESLLLARIEYLAGRAWQDAGEKKKAIARYEASIAHARNSMSSGEHADGWMAVVEPLSQMCILKDLAYLVLNGPKISQYAQKALDLDPSHVGARITIAASKSYPPAIFGGDPAEAVRLMQALLAGHPGEFEKDDLFNIRSGIATAYAKMNEREEARRWFGLALELYPGNRYAREELRKLAK